MVLGEKVRLREPPDLVFPKTYKQINFDKSLSLSLRSLANIWLGSISWFNKQEKFTKYLMSTKIKQPSDLIETAGEIILDCSASFRIERSRMAFII